MICNLSLRPRLFQRSEVPSTSPVYLFVRIPFTTKGLSFSHQGPIGEAVKNPILDAAKLAAKKPAEEAAAKVAELDAIWGELNSIPAKIEALEAQINSVSAALKASSQKSAEARLKDLLASQVRGTQYHPSHIIEAATAVVIARAKADVLEEYRVELRNELAELKRRDAELTRRLS